jgi:hypothetical protein
MLGETLFQPAEMAVCACKAFAHAGTACADFAGRAGFRDLSAQDITKPHVVLTEDLEGAQLASALKKCDHWVNMVHGQIAYDNTVIKAQVNPDPRKIGQFPPLFFDHEWMQQALTGKVADRRNNPLFAVATSMLAVHMSALQGGNKSYAIAIHAQ